MTELDLKALHDPDAPYPGEGERARVAARAHDLLVRRRRRRMLVASLAGVALVATAIGVASATRESEPSVSVVSPPPTVATRDVSAENSIRDAFLHWINAKPKDAVDQYVEDYASIAEAHRQGIAQHSEEELAKYSGRVESIEIIDSTHANVRYTILFDGNPQYANQAGEAIKVDGAWKVSRDTVCDLLIYGGIACPPRAGSTTTVPVPVKITN
jgi:hypothetical protein